MSNQRRGAVNGPLADSCDHVRVDVSGDRNRGVPEQFRDSADVGTTGEHEAGRGMPQPVECQLWERLTVLAEHLKQPGDVRGI